MLLAFGAEMREIDRKTIEDIGMPGVALMENAGKGVTDAMLAALEGVAGRVAVLCGPGNNGGDGYVVARHLVGRDYDVEVFLLAAPERIQGDAAINLRIIEAMDVPITRLDKEALDDEAFHATLRELMVADFDVWVDAMLGTGLSSEVKGRYAELIELMNALRDAQGNFVLAIDVPSGLSADTGQILGHAVEADLTVTLGLAKPGLLLYPGRSLCGGIEVIDIGFPRNVLDDAQLKGHLLDADFVRPLITPRTANSHKGTYGHALVLAGAPGKSGAAILAGAGALRAGAGLVTVGTHAEVVPQVATLAWELMADPIYGTDDAPDEVLRDLLSKLKISAVAIGPGLGTRFQARRVLETLLTLFDGPCVLDADALNMVAKDVSLLERVAGQLILTPHPGEMARLIGGSVLDVTSNTLTCARRLAEKHNAIVALKTAATVIAHPDGRYAINTRGTPGMSSAGMGDVLTGIIAGLLSQGVAAWEATCAAVYLHGVAGERAEETHGQRGMSARSVLASLPEILREFETADSSTF